MKLCRKMFAAILLLVFSFSCFASTDLKADSSGSVDTITVAGSNDSFTVHQPPSNWDAVNASDAQLKYYGYPARPNDSVELIQWKKLVSATWIKPEFKESNINHTVCKSVTSKLTNYFSSPNWSGYVREGTDGSIVKSYGVDGYWKVPSVSSSSMQGYSSQWVGLGGEGKNTTSKTLAQIGTDSICYDNSVGGLSCNYHPWVEIYGSKDYHNGDEYPIPNFTISPGDTMYGYVMITSYNNTNVTYNFFLEDLSKSTVVSFSPSPVSITDNNGSNLSAEWISENTLYNYPRTVTDGAKDNPFVHFLCCRYEKNIGDSMNNMISSTDSTVHHFVMFNSTNNNLEAEPNTISDGGFKIFWRAYH